MWGRLLGLGRGRSGPSSQPSALLGRDKEVLVLVPVQCRMVQSEAQVLREQSGQRGGQDGRLHGRQGGQEMERSELQQG